MWASGKQNISIMVEEFIIKVSAYHVIWVKILIFLTISFDLSCNYSIMLVTSHTQTVNTSNVKMHFSLKQMFISFLKEYF